MENIVDDLIDVDFGFRINEIIEDILGEETHYQLQYLI